MVGDIGWALIAAAILVVEALSLRATGRSGIHQIGVRIAQRRGGRGWLFALWLFVGIHLFSRYGIQR